MEGKGDKMKEIICQNCGAKEIEALTPRTVYACGSSDYDQRPGTFKMKCEAKNEQL